MFYETYKDLTKLPTALAKLPWSHNCLLIDKVPEISKRSWYAEKCFENGWSFVVLDHQIDPKLYERQADNSKKLVHPYGILLAPLVSSRFDGHLKVPEAGTLSIQFDALSELPQSVR